MQNLLWLLPDSVTGALLPLLLVGAGIFYILQMRGMAATLIMTVLGLLFIPAIFDALITPLLDKLSTSCLLLANLVFLFVVVLLIIKSCISMLFGRRVADEATATLLANTIIGMFKGVFKLGYFLVTWPCKLFCYFRKS